MKRKNSLTNFWKDYNKFLEIFHQKFLEISNLTILVVASMATPNACTPPLWSTFFKRTLNLREIYKLQKLHNSKFTHIKMANMVVCVFCLFGNL